MPADCRRCGSAGSVEFGMCQVCYHDHARDIAARGREGDSPSRADGARVTERADPISDTRVPIVGMLEEAALTA